MTKPLTLAEIAKALDARLVGDGSLRVKRVCHPADVQGAQDLPVATDKKLLPILTESGAKMAVFGPDQSEKPAFLDGCLFVERPRYALAKLTTLFEEKIIVPTGIHPTAIIEPGAKLGKNVAIGPYVLVAAEAVLGANSVLHSHISVGPGAVIGENALIYAGVKIGARVQIGARCLVHFNATIGADGFSFVTPQLGSVESAKSTGHVGATNVELARIASLGTVILGDDVEIGANTSIDRGTLAATRVGNGTKIDNQVQIGHNVVIGDNCLICGRVGIAGSAVIGNRVVLGGATGVADHVQIGDDAIAMGMSGIAGNIP
ncbi:MAG: UDP-3-O-(3-hydroxymyristoyl)glucosamine N-acyltransferase, partial [Alphaproteobacteria bacterium]|nr:UDP-3-O-(3-hydroxymyristoyl)glucosamine N-acyltransferase [Alphaproteobacteria bacterium]